MTQPTEARMWTHFWDMNSGGDTKEKWPHIFIEAPEAEARIIFYNRFGHNPDRVTCTCCGADYAVSEYPTLEKATKFQRQRYGDRAPQALDAYIASDDVYVIYARDIKPSERTGTVPEQGYVWRD